MLTACHGQTRPLLEPLIVVRPLALGLYHICFRSDTSNLISTICQESSCISFKKGSYMAQTMTHPLEAFCATCPAVQEVTAVLQALGLTLTFHMDAVISPEYTQLPPLPAQFHYRDRHASEVIFLAGHDAGLDGVRLPAHASRFWIYPGANAGVAWWIAHTLARKWSLVWQHEAQPRQGVGKQREASDAGCSHHL